MLKKTKKIFIFFILCGLPILGLAFCLDKIFPLNLNKYFNQSTVLLDKNGQILSLGLTTDEKIRLPITIEAIDSLFIRLLINFEDKRFYYHPGIDPLALLRATGQCLKNARIISGGSTITMQVARLLEPRPRKLKYKCRELFRALQLEYHFSKKEILALYLSLAPYGGNLEGIRAGSLSYFAKEPKYLKPAEAALLAVLPQSPTRLRPDIAAAKAKQYRDKLIARMQLANIFTAKEAIEAKEDLIPKQRISFPRLALHLHYLANKKTNLQTTLDKTLQERLEQHLKNEVPFLESTQTCAALIVDNQNCKVLAYVGSADFFAEHKQGQVDMIQAIRSPGSTLKPFIYGLGFDLNLMHPETIIKDAPTNFGAYTPSNFQDTFHGDISIREALQQSLNIPTVLALEKIGPVQFYEWITKLGIQLKFRSDMQKPSLPLALGGVGIRFYDLMSLYTALGNQGEFKPLILFEEVNNTINKMGSNKNNENKAEKVFLTKEAAWHLTNILHSTHAPSGFVDNQFIRQSAFAFKTGTSYGYRDAWAIGFTKAYTIGIWVGKADGSPSVNQTGRNTAAPILFKLLNLLPASKDTWQLQAPEGNLSLKRQELPQHLRFLQAENIKTKAKTQQTFSIQFPKDGSILAIEAGKAMHIILSGGKPPYYLFVNGKPLTENFSQSDIVWQPETMGFMELSVLDSKGQADNINIELKSN